MARNTDAIISKYQRARVHRSDFVRGEKTTFRANFNGAVDDTVLIDSVTWRTAMPWALILTNPQIESGLRSVSVDILMGYAGPASLKCIMTFRNGQVRNQLYDVSIRDQPLMDEAYPTQGATSVTYTYPRVAVSVSPTQKSGSVSPGLGIISIGSVAATASAGTPPYTYQWSLSNVVPSPVYSLTTATSANVGVRLDTNQGTGTFTGNLNLTVTDAIGDTATATVPLSYDISPV